MTSIPHSLASLSRLPIFPPSERSISETAAAGSPGRNPGSPSAWYSSLSFEIASPSPLSEYSSLACLDHHPPVGRFRARVFGRQTDLCPRPPRLATVRLLAMPSRSTSTVSFIPRERRRGKEDSARMENPLIKDPTMLVQLYTSYSAKATDVRISI